MLIDLLPDPPAWAVISGVLGWDLAVLWVIWKLSGRPAKRHRFRGPSRAQRKALRRGRTDRIERVYNDLW